jgi:lipopolysaccharide export system permease protein
MGILTRYLIRSLVGPFLFSIGAMTGLLFLNAVAQRLDMLVGKGLGWEIIGEFLLLSLPHTIALTLPMAVLIAVLYTFVDLTANSEVTAMSAGGVQPTRLLWPMLGVGAVMAGLTFFFNDQVLPEANHQLKNLMIDIGNKSPTLELRDQVVNEISTDDQRSRFFIQATSIDQATNALDDVVIFDVSDPAKHRTIYADSGKMAFNREQTDLFLTLHDGMVYQADGNREGTLQRTGFQTQVIPLRGVGDVLERTLGGSARSDREMSVALLKQEADAQRAHRDEAADESYLQSLHAVRQALGLPKLTDSVEAVADDKDPEMVAAVESVRAQFADRGEIAEDAMTRTVTVTVRTSRARDEVAAAGESRYWVEIHKKFAISAACIVFVLLGLPLAIRFPGGGVGMVISVSVGIFGVYWMGLIGGENLADRGAVSPFWAMWTPNLIFLLLGLSLVTRLGRQAGSMRSSSWDEVRFAIGSLAAKLFGRARAEAA